VTRDRKRFVAAIRTRVFMFLRAWSLGEHAGALGVLDSPREGTDDRAWMPEDLKCALEAYRVEHGPIRFDPRRATSATPTSRRSKTPASGGSNRC